MKCRLSHVTNSSSSSFMLATHDSCKRGDIKTAWNNMRDEIKRMIEYNGDYLNFKNKDINDLLKIEDIDQATELAIEELTDNLYDFVGDNPWVVGYWECEAQEFYDDDGDFLSLFLMRHSSNFNCNTLKLSRGN